MTTLREAAQAALAQPEPRNQCGETCERAKLCAVCARGLEQQEQEQAESVTHPGGWSVFNTGVEVASGLTFAEAWDYMTPKRLERGWSAVCVVNKDNLPMTQLAAIAKATGEQT